MRMKLMAELMAKMIVRSYFQDSEASLEVCAELLIWIPGKMTGWLEIMGIVVASTKYWAGECRGKKPLCQKPFCQNASTQSQPVAHQRLNSTSFHDLLFLFSVARWNEESDFELRCLKCWHTHLMSLLWHVYALTCLQWIPPAPWLAWLNKNLQQGDLPKWFCG